MCRLVSLNKPCLLFDPPHNREHLIAQRNRIFLIQLQLGKLGARHLPEPLLPKAPPLHPKRGHSVTAEPPRLTSARRHVVHGSPVTRTDEQELQDARPRNVEPVTDATEPSVQGVALDDGGVLVLRPDASLQGLPDDPYAVAQTLDVPDGEPSEKRGPVAPLSELFLVWVATSAGPALGDV